jgi:hypothetical protein
MEIVVILGKRALWLTPYPDADERVALLAAVRKYLVDTMGTKPRQCMVVVNGREQQVILLDFTQDGKEEVYGKLAYIKVPLEAAASIRGVILQGMKLHTEASGEVLGAQK